MSEPIDNAPALWSERLPWPKSGGHKHDRGRLYVVSGGATHTGAARLAARAGLRMGAGLVTVLSPPAAVLVNAAHLEAVMLKAFAGADDLAAAAERASAVVIGPAAGVGAATAQNVLALAATDAALVLDADALTSFRETPARLFAAIDARSVLTPHAGEFERLFPGRLAEVGRIEAARRAAGASGAVVLLKGEETVIAHPDGRTVINRHATPFLATAGSGDVLAGMIGALLAQGMAAFDAASAAAWIHGEAGRRVGPGLIAEDLPDRLASVLGDLWRGEAGK